VVCISAHEVRLAREAGIAGSKLLHIGNGIPREAPSVDAAANRPMWPEGKCRVLFVGRFDRQKGVDVLVSALSALGETHFGYLVGDSVLGDGASLNLPGNVRATGWLSGADLSAYYESADMLVAPSRWEGFGLIAAEGMRAGLPVIASRVGGLAEIVEHGVTGLLVDPDNCQVLIGAIQSLDAARLRAMGDAGRERFLQHFTLDRAHTQLTALYQSLLTRFAASHVAGEARAVVDENAAPAAAEGSPNV
jgi:glycosyltransferase involved in cell wall biosynthesis